MGWKQEGKREKKNFPFALFILGILSVWTADIFQNEHTEQQRPDELFSLSIDFMLKDLALTFDVLNLAWTFRPDSWFYKYSKSRKAFKFQLKF